MAWVRHRILCVILANHGSQLLTCFRGSGASFPDGLARAALRSARLENILHFVEWGCRFQNVAGIGLPHSEDVVYKVLLHVTIAISHSSGLTAFTPSSAVGSAVKSVPRNNRWIDG